MANQNETIVDGRYVYFINVSLPTTEDSSAFVLWPCLHFDDHHAMTTFVSQMSRADKSEVSLSILGRISSGRPFGGSVAFLLGDTVPGGNRCLWTEGGELVDFLTNLVPSFAKYSTFPGFSDATQGARQYLEQSGNAPPRTPPAAQDSKPTASVAVPNAAASAEAPAPSTAVSSNAATADPVVPNAASSNDSTKAKSVARARPKVDTRRKAQRDVVVSLDSALAAEEDAQPNKPMSEELSTPSSVATQPIKPLASSKRKMQPTTASAASVKKSKQAVKQSKKPEDRLPSFEDVRGLLTKQGYIFKDGLFCRPGMNPRKNEQAQDGTDYFPTAKAFREHLCAFGVDGVCSKWSEEDELLVQKWVRYAVVRSIDGLDALPEYEELKDRNAAHALLRNLGMHMLNTGLKRGYAFPGVSKADAMDGINFFADENGSNGTWMRLQRFGWPLLCNTEGLSSKELVSLELFFCETGDMKTFERLQVDSNGFITSGVSARGSERSTQSSKRRQQVQLQSTVVVASAASPSAIVKKPRRAAKHSNTVVVASAASPSAIAKKPRCAAKHSKTVVSSAKEAEDRLPSFEDVRGLLTKQGYIFKDGLFCRPGMNPRKNKQAQDGTDFFPTAKAFREHLCAFGVDGVCSKWSEEDKLLVQTWVRYAVVRSIDGLDGLPERDELKEKQASRLLNSKILNYWSVGLKQGYAFPGVSKAEGLIDGVNFFSAENGPRDANGMWMRLHRFGLPLSSTEGLSSKELVSLELFFSENEDMETFERLQVDSDGLIVSADVSPRGSERLDGRASRSTRKRADADDNSTAISAESLGITAQKSLKKRPASQKKGKSAKASTAKNTKSVKKARNTRATSQPRSVAKTLQYSLQGLKESPRMIPGSPKVEWEAGPLPEIKGTAKEKLTACLEALKQTHEAGNDSFYRSGAGQFSSNLKTIFNFLAASIESNGEHGGQDGDPAALYVCGVPGIGKTSGVKWCCEQAVAQANRNRDDSAPEPTVIHFNGGSLSSATAPMKVLFGDIAKGIGMNAQSKPAGIIQRIKRQHMVVIILDEIDMLVSKNSQRVNGDKLLGAEGAIQQLLQWAGDEDMPIALVGISNSSANVKYHRLRQIGKFQDTVTFSAYSAEDLVGIVQARIGDKVFDPKAMKFMAMKSSTIKGDARDVLSLATETIKGRIQSLSEGKRLPKSPDAPLVGIPDVIQAVKKAALDIPAAIEGLPAMGKAILCVLTTLAQESITTTSLGKLRRFVTSAMDENQRDEVLTLEDFKSLVETLCDNGLLAIKGKLDAGTANLIKMPISLGYQLEDVEIAINNGIGKERFYEKMRELTKRNTPHFR